MTTTLRNDIHPRGTREIEYNPEQGYERILSHETIGLAFIPEGIEIENVAFLTKPVAARLAFTKTGVLATMQLKTEEYGWGENQILALRNLLSSLLAYMVSLERREARLGEDSLEDLRLLRQLIRKKS